MWGSLPSTMNATDTKAVSADKNVPMAVRNSAI
jgi:hypothetical protein